MLIPSYYPSVGGAGRQLESLLPFLNKERIQSLILTRRLPGTQAREQMDGVQIIRLDAYEHTPSFLIYSFIWLVQQRDEWDLIHVHTAFSPALVAATARWLLGKPVIVKIPSHGPKTALDQMKSSWWGRIRLQYLCRSVNGFVVVNSAMYNELLSIGIHDSKLFNITNGVDIDKFHPIPRTQRIRLREEHKLTDSPVVIYVGRLAPRKGIRFLVENWPSVLQKNPKTTLLIIGDGPLRNELEKLVQNTCREENVRFYGDCEHNEVVRFLQLSDCFVLPSPSEGNSNALLEAMSTGLVPIVSHNEGNLEVVQNGVNGLVFNDHKSLCEQITQCLKQDDYREELGVTARQTVVDRFSISQTASRLTKAYHQLLL
ncbi:glycosyltransferase family 4 protein [Chloroflexota bacterium]